jgi:hypothetical protein
MAMTTIHPHATGLAAPRQSTTRPVAWLRIMVGSLLAMVLLIGLMALAGRALPPHPDWAVPSPGVAIELADG